LFYIIILSILISISCVNIVVKNPFEVAKFKARSLCNDIYRKPRKYVKNLIKFNVIKLLFKLTIVNHIEKYNKKNRIRSKKEDIIRDTIQFVPIYGTLTNLGAEIIEATYHKITKKYNVTK